VLYESYINDKLKARNYFLKYLRLAHAANDASLVKAWIIQIDKARKAEQK